MRSFGVRGPAAGERGASSSRASSRRLVAPQPPVQDRRSSWGPNGCRGRLGSRPTQRAWARAAVELPLQPGNAAQPVVDACDRRRLGDTQAPFQQALMDRPHVLRHGEDDRSRPAPATGTWWAKPRSRVVIGTTTAKPTGQALNAEVETISTGLVPPCSPGEGGSSEARHTSPRSSVDVLTCSFLPRLALIDVSSPGRRVGVTQSRRAT